MIRLVLAVMGANRGRRGETVAHERTKVVEKIVGKRS
jgi:hypothetical protein